MSLEKPQTDWFLAQLKPNCAKIAKTSLSRQGFQTFLPMEDVTRQRNGVFVTAARPLFPGYIFVAFDVSAGHWRAVNSTSGITRLVSFGKAPAPVPHALVGELIARCDGTGHLLPPDELKAGDRVTLTRGPFANVVAEIAAVAPDQRVWVLIDIMGRQTRVAVAAGQVKLA